MNNVLQFLLMSLVAYPSSEIQLPDFLAQLADHLSIDTLYSYFFEIYT